MLFLLVRRIISSHEDYYHTTAILYRNLKNLRNVFRKLTQHVEKFEIVALSPHSAGGLTEKRISGKGRKKAEGRKNVSGSGVSNRKTGPFGKSRKGLPRSRNSRVAG